MALECGAKSHPAPGLKIARVWRAHSLERAGWAQHLTKIHALSFRYLRLGSFPLFPSGSTGKSARATGLIVWRKFQLPD